MDSKDHAILRIDTNLGCVWKKLLWLSTKEAFFRHLMITKYKWLTYWEYKIKSREDLTVYYWVMSTEKLAKMYKNISNRYWKCEHHKGIFYHPWWYHKARKIWIQIHSFILKILEINVQLKPEDRKLENLHETLFLYMTVVARLLYSQKWKTLTLPTIEEWLLKMIELTEMAKLSSYKLFVWNVKKWIDDLWYCGKMIYGYTKKRGVFVTIE